MNPLQHLAGADPETLRKFPGERNRYTGMGGAILLTGGFAALSGTFFLHDFLDVPVVLAALLGLLWGLGIMNLDRWMLVSTKRQRNWRMTLLMATPRVLLAATIGFVIAEPVVLRVFHVEVMQEARTLKKERYDEARADVKRQFTDISVLEARQNALRNAAVPDPETVLSNNPRYQTLTGESKTLNDRLDELRSRRRCELSGRCESTRNTRRYLQNEIRTTRNRANAAKKEIKAMVAAARKVLVRQAPTRSADLTRVSTELTARQTQREDALKDTKEDYLAEIGLMDRIEALHALNGDRSGTAFFTWILRLLIFLIDMVPILFKTVGLLGKPSAAELDEEDREIKEHARLKAARQRKLDDERKAAEQAAGNAEVLRRHDYEVAEAKSEQKVLEANSNKRLVAEKTEELQARILAGQTQVAHAVIDAWNEEALAAVPDLVKHYASSPGVKQADPAPADDRRQKPSADPSPPSPPFPFDDQVPRERFKDRRAPSDDARRRSFMQHPATPGGDADDPGNDATARTNGHPKEPTI